MALSDADVQKQVDKPLTSLALVFSFDTFTCARVRVRFARAFCRFYPRDAMLARVLAMVRSLSVSVCQSRSSVKTDERIELVFGTGAPSTNSTLSYKKIRFSPKIRATFLWNCPKLWTWKISQLRNVQISRM